VDLGHLNPDPSVPEVREFIESCIRTVILDWGFEGIKLDFYSWMFDHPDAVFQNGGTGIYWRHWLTGLIRSLLGSDGYFLHCIACPRGNPFLALNGHDAYRAGIDIDCGDWAHHLRSSCWVLPSILGTGKTTWYANLDSCMGDPSISAVERRSRLAFCYITAGMLEFGGVVESFDEEMRMDYRRMAERCDQGGEVLCPDREAFFGLPYPTTLVRIHADDSYTCKRWGINGTIGLFNWGDEPRVVNLPLGVPELDPRNALLRDFWTGHVLEPARVSALSPLPGRGSLLVDVVRQ
jgi:hypothetical protein